MRRQKCYILQAAFMICAHSCMLVCVCVHELDEFIDAALVFLIRSAFGSHTCVTLACGGLPQATASYLHMSRSMQVLKAENGLNMA